MSGMLLVHDFKILIFDGQIYPYAEMSTEYLKRYLANFEQIILFGLSFSPEDNMAPLNAPWVPPAQVQFELIPYKASLKDKCKKLEEQIKKADYVVAKVPSVLGNMAAVYSNRYQKNCLLEVVACAWDTLWHQSIKRKAFALPFFLFTKYVIKKGQYVNYVTREYLQKRYPTRGRKAAISDVVLPAFTDEILQQRILNIKKAGVPIVLGTVGAVQERDKGQQFVIEAMGRLKAKGISKIYYQLVGGGEQTYLKKLAVKNNVGGQVSFLGTLPHEEIFKWLDRIDIYVQPGKAEGLPRALLEAMSRGVPCIGYDGGGTIELLESRYRFQTGLFQKHRLEVILNELTEEEKICMAEQNFRIAIQYDYVHLEKKRRQFFESFIKGL